MIMRTQYIKSGSKYFALNFKAASSSIIRAIISSHYPEIEDKLVNCSTYPDGRTADNSRLHGIIPKTDDPNGEVVLIVRDPIERFRSACAETRKTPDEALSEQGQKNIHFWPTSRFLANDCRLYRFESDLAEAAAALGLSLPLPNIINPNGEKPDLTAEQLLQVQTIYAEDIALYESINETGQIWTTPSTPVTDEMKSVKLAEIKAARKAAENAGVEIQPFGLIATDLETQMKLSAVYTKALNDPTYTKNWKVGASTWAVLDATTIIAIGDAVEAHVQAQFDREETCAKSILAATTAEELSSITW